jgi:Zn-dependent peptidase ImmA (M78 family)
VIIYFINTICKDENIILSGWTNIKSGVALHFPDDTLRSIGYGIDLKGWEQIAVIAHELGHHVLGHLNHSRDKINKSEINREELEANIFAASFVACAFFHHHNEKLKGSVLAAKPKQNRSGKR